MLCNCVTVLEMERAVGATQVCTHARVYACMCARTRVCASVCVWVGGQGEEEAGGWGGCAYKHSLEGERWEKEWMWTYQHFEIILFIGLEVNYTIKKKFPQAFSINFKIRLLLHTYKSIIIIAFSNSIEKNTILIIQQSSCPNTLHSELILPAKRGRKRKGKYRRRCGVLGTSKQL